MKSKNIFFDSLFYLIVLVVSCLLNLLVTWMAVKIVDLFIVANYFVSAVVQVISAFITLGVIIGVLSYYDGYKTVSHSIKEKTLAMLLAGIWQLTLSLLLMFYPFIAGGVRSLAGLINEGIHFSSSECIKNIYLWQYLVAYLIYLVFEIVVLNVCGMIGKNNRIKSRRELDGYEEIKS